MFLIAVATALILGFALMALLLVLVARPIVGGWLRYSSAYMAVGVAYLATMAALLLVAYVGDLRLNRLLAADAATVAIVLLQMLLLVWGVRVFCKHPNGDRVALRSASMVAVITTLIATATGWLAFKPVSTSILPSAATRARVTASQGGSQGSTSQASARSLLCLHNLSLTLTDTGNGPNPIEALAYRERLHQEAKSKSIGLDQVLKPEVAKLGTQVPLGCEHLK